MIIVYNKCNIKISTLPIPVEYILSFLELCVYFRSYYDLHTHLTVKLTKYVAIIELSPVLYYVGHFIALVELLWKLDGIW